MLIYDTKYWELNEQTESTDKIIEKTKIWYIESIESDHNISEFCVWKYI